ncbi:hypothetical protein KAR91_11685, partial [Candidatus Pacearchaeota archaeon]|nr:hypothetical protein [Candidatus Pacearchaeota archaeon]
MADLFDEIAKTASTGDIFDEVATAPKVAPISPQRSIYSDSGGIPADMAAYGKAVSAPAYDERLAPKGESALLGSRAGDDKAWEIVKAAKRGVPGAVSALGGAL